MCIAPSAERTSPDTRNFRIDRPQRRSPASVHRTLAEEASMGFVRLVDIEVAAPPTQIFPLVSDIRRHPEWAYNTLTVAHVDGPEIGPGAHYTSTVTDA